MLAVVLLAAMPAFAVSVFFWKEHQRLAYSSATHELDRLVESACTAHANLLSGIRQEIRLMATLPDVREGDPSKLDPFFADFLNGHPHYVIAGLIRPDGTIAACGLPVPEGTNLSDRGYFRDAMDRGDFSSGQYQRGRISGKISINFGHPVEAPDGSRKGVLFFGLSIDWLGDFLASADLPGGSTITVIDSKGVVLARHPEPEQWVGKSLTEAPLVAAILQKRQGGTLRSPGLDGVDRIYAYRPLRIGNDPSGVYVAVGMPAAEVFARSDRLLTAGAVAVLVSVALALLASWFVGNPLLVSEHERMSQSAVTDPLTGLYNRRGFAHLAAQSVRVASRSRNGFWIAAIDLDGLKKVNDTLGHAAGDRLIQSAAIFLRRAFRGSDLVARTGGDEFVVLAADSGRDRLEAIRARLQADLELFNRGAEVPLRFSAGWAYFDPALMPPIESVLASADKALYEEKARNR